MNRAEQDALELAIAGHLAHGELGAAATAALRGYGPQILGFLVTALHDDEAAREVFAQFSENLWRGLPEFRQESAFRTWAYRLAWNAANRWRRDERRRPVRPLQTAEISKIVEEVRSSTARFQRTTVKDRLAKLREQLTPDERALLVLRVDRRLSWKDVAEVLSTPESPLNEIALRKRFDRIKQKLRKLADEAGLISR